MELLILYWILTTSYGIYWSIKNPSSFDDQDDFTILEVLGKVFPAALLSWILVPIFILASIKFKR
jgi:hypothetical protein